MLCSRKPRQIDIRPASRKIVRRRFERFPEKLGGGVILFFECRDAGEPIPALRMFGRLALLFECFAEQILCFIRCFDRV